MVKHSNSKTANLVLVEVDGRIIPARFVPFNTLPEHRVWTAMWTRCTNPNSIGYADYGGRGIMVCDRWKDFTAFYMDMGPRPTPQHSIDRRENDGNYEPGNCHWVTADVQARNKRNAVFIEYEGKPQRLVDLAHRFGLSSGHVYGRVRSGWTVEEALTTPVNTHKNPRKLKHAG